MLELLLLVLLVTAMIGGAAIGNVNIIVVASVSCLLQVQLYNTWLELDTLVMLTIPSRPLGYDQV